MKAITINFFLLTALLSLMSCGAGQKNLSLSVTTGFSLTAAGYTGGLIAYGESTNGERFSVSASTGKTVSVKIADGEWKVFVMGWEETSGLKFRGIKHCGMTNVKLGAEDLDINVTVTPANCELAEFQSEASVQNLLISSCGGFYHYAPTTDTFSPLTAADGDAFCSALPNSLSYSHPYYKLVSTNIVSKELSPGLSTECLATSPANGVRLVVPTKKFPWSVKMYRSLKDCQATVAVPHVNYPLPSGITAGNQPSFDQYFISNAAYEAHLSLPSSSTRRGYSPFINVQPRILCSGVDCFTAPNTPFMGSPYSTSKVDFDVRWENFNNYNDRSPTLIKGFKTSNVSTSCDTATLSFLNSSPYFSASNCQIDRGDLQANLNRNAFTCRGNADMSGMVDLYERDNKIYVVSKYFQSPNYHIKITAYSKSGVLLAEVQVPWETSQVYKSMTVDAAGTIYALIEVPTPMRKLYRFPYLSTEQRYDTTAAASPYTSDTYPHLSYYDEIEATTGTTFVGASSTDVQAFTISSAGAVGTAGTMTALSSATSVQKLQFKDGYLYALSGNGSVSNIHAINISGLTLSNTGSPAIAPPYLSESFHITTVGTQRYLLLVPKAYAGMVKVYNLNSDNSVGVMEASYTLANYGFTSVLAGGSLLMLEGASGSAATTGTANLSAWKFSPGTPTIANAQSPNLDQCEAHLEATIDSTLHKLNLASRRNMNVKIVFDEAFRNIGRRLLNSPQTSSYFESLQSDGDDDNGRSEGLLNRASSMMGPDGLGGVLNGLYPNQTCAQLKTAAGSAGLNNSFVLNDTMKGESRTFSISITANADLMHDLTCTTSPCSTSYDLSILISSPGIEKIKLQLSCSQKVGSMESVDIEDSEIKHELTIWNTVSGINARYENYEIEDKGDKKRINISTLIKSDENNLVQRYVELNRSPSSIEGRVSEMAVSGSNIMTSSINTPNLTYANFSTSNSNLSNGFMIQEIIQNTAINGLMPMAGSCMSTSNTDPLATSSGSCSNLAHTIGQTSIKSDLDYNLESLKGYTDGTGTSAQFYSIFTLSP